MTWTTPSRVRSTEEDSAAGHLGHCKPLNIQTNFTHRNVPGTRSYATLLFMWWGPQACILAALYTRSIPTSPIHPVDAR